LIEVDPVKCVGCGACVRICPPKALTIEVNEKETILKYFIGRCIFCWMCVQTCPQKAIKTTNKFELSAVDVHELQMELVHNTVKCRVCGKPFITSKFVKEVGRRLNGGFKDDLLYVCPTCRRKLTAKKIATKVTGVE